MRCLAVFKAGLEKAPTHMFYDSDEDFLAAASAYDQLGKNVYHACSAFREDAAAQDRPRAGTNTVAVKALWSDLDVGETKPFKTQREAVLAAEQFRAAVGLPASYIVSSGSGVHIYYPFIQAISPENWDRVAAAFAACMNHFGLSHDRSRTRDKASILRIPGTHNYKTEPPKAVRILRAGVEERAGDIYKKLKAYAEANGFSVALASSVGKPNGPSNDLIGNPTYPPSEGDQVAQLCPIIREVEQTGGDVSYEVWWRAMGVAKHTTKPEETAAHWTRNRAATGHGKYDHIAIVSAWGYGPTTCEQFSQHSGACASCPHNGNIKSPIQLGVSPEPVVTPVAQPAPTPPAAKPMAQPWTFGAQWIMDRTAAKHKIGYANGHMTVSVMDDNGVPSHKPFCDRYWQVMRRVRGDTGQWQLVIGYEQYPGHPHKEFTIDSAGVTNAQCVRETFSAHELHIYGGPKGMSAAQNVLMFQQNLLYQHMDEVKTYAAMGWATEGNLPAGNLTGEFVLGTTVFTPGKPESTGMLGDRVPTEYNSPFQQRGTPTGWVTIIDRIYNRPNVEAYQFAILAAFAAPLVKLMPGNGEWHGIPLILSGDSGAAKTSTAKVAMTLYGHPEWLKIAGGQETGDTKNALAARFGAIRNLPFLVDETTGATAEFVSSLMFMTANGMARGRCGPDGRLLPNHSRWSTLSFVTSNDEFHEKLTSLRNRSQTEAAQYRSFELEFDKHHFAREFPDITKADVDGRLLGEQYGTVGPLWLQFLVNNRLKIEKMLGKMSETYTLKDYTSGMRKYHDLLVTMKVAGELTKRKGFLGFDMDALMYWAEQRVYRLAGRIADVDWDTKISDFLASLNGKTLVTKHFPHTIGGRRVSELPLIPLPANAVVEARKALEDKEFYVTASYLKHWCDENAIKKKSMLNEMLERKFLDGTQKTMSVDIHRISLGAGTTMTRPRALCYRINFDRAESTGMGADSVEDPDDLSNVVPITPAVTDSVTEPAADTAQVAVSP